MNTYTYTDLKEWESDKDLFYFLTPKGEVKKHIYKTPQANLVNDLLVRPRLTPLLVSIVHAHKLIRFWRRACSGT
jgi:hypothetical protein